MMRRKLYPLAAGLLLALALLPLKPAAGQDHAAISCNAEVPGIIDSATYTNEWTLALKSDQIVTLTATTTTGDLDTYLLLRSIKGSTLDENDDAPRTGSSSQITRMLQAGLYIVDVTRSGQQSGTSSGEYVLTVRCAAPAELMPQPDAPDTGEDVLFADDFSRENDDWWLGETDNGAVWIADGELHILDYADTASGMDTTLTGDLTDFILTVDTRLVSGALDSWQVILFRFDTRVDYYEIGFSADGSYMGDIIRDYQLVEEIAPLTPTKAIRQGIDVVNTIRLEAIGNRVRFTINDVLLIDTVISADSAISAGRIGLAISAAGGTDTCEVAWDNLRIVRPPPRHASPQRRQGHLCRQPGSSHGAAAGYSRGRVSRSPCACPQAG